MLFGKDSYQPDEYPYYWRVFETNDEYFDYYRDYHAFWKLYGIGLPDPVLQEALLSERAEGRRPGLSRARVHGLTRSLALADLEHLWLLISSPAAPASSDRISRKSSCAAATPSASPTA